MNASTHSVKPLTDEEFKALMIELKGLLKNREVSQKAFAAKVGVSYSLFNKMIRGEMRCDDLKTLAAISRESGLPFLSWVNTER